MSTARERLVRRAPANRWTAAVVLAHDPSGAGAPVGPFTVAGQRRSCTGFPRPGTGICPVPGPREPSGVARDRCRAGTLGECDPRQQPPGPGIPWPGSCGRSRARRRSSSLRARSTWRSSSGSRGSSSRSTRRTGPTAGRSRVLLAIGVGFTVFRIVISGLTAHPRRIDVLMTLPQVTMPRLLGGFTLGGTVEAGVVLQTLAQGFAIVGMMAVFGAFNAIASHYELVQSSPRAFHELGVVTTVALAFVPSTIESVSAVREADRARTGGRSIRRGRILRSIVPVLERGMERAVALSESMDARVRLRGQHARGPGRRLVRSRRTARARGRVRRARRPGPAGRDRPRARRDRAPGRSPPCSRPVTLATVAATATGAWRRPTG